MPPDSLDVDAAYQDFCNTIKKAAKKTIPRGYRNNYIPCWDAECESLYKTFLQSPQRNDSSLAATALLSKLDRKRRDRWSEAIRTIDLSTTEYCAPVWCRSAHTCLIDSVLNDALRIVTGCLRPIPSDHLPVLSGIQPAELRRLGATLSLAHRGSLDPDHILYGLLSGSSDTRQARLRSRRPFVPAGRNLLNNFARLGIRASEWTNHKWKMEYCENASRLRVFVPGTGARPVGMGLPRAAWIKLNCLRTGVGRFHSSMHKWGLAPSPNCECGASDQTADHVLTACPIHRAPHRARGLMVLDDETRCQLNETTASI